MVEWIRRLVIAFKAAGNPISVLREHLLVNVASIGGTGTNPTAQNDFFPELSRIDGTPARPAKTHDATDYAANPLEDSWEVRLAGAAFSPAHNQNAAALRGGQMT